MDFGWRGSLLKIEECLNALTEVLVLTIPNENNAFVIYTDASVVGLGSKTVADYLSSAPKLEVGNQIKELKLNLLA